ncbi:alpha-N-arabinofuranosidase [Ruminococcus albus]|uniref:non-reducing end alpha-L-arabinofuranosidase n=1 Tax=Ruminococcus albus TaxID=1264 RepID=A0A1H7HYR7_RUMAL|nr:alpha-L-arabinofuranosidase C-terminal domain-containing protein [Ruminococcus albus]SEK54310.1 alpha-N-arabinofuranosidase [Ruminococcus albus]
MKNFKMLVNANDKTGHINREIYGHFSEHLGRCIYGGIYVGEDSSIPNIHGIRKDVIEAFKQIKMPVLRWPGGCFADEYHWKDGIGEKSSRKKMVNTNWGGVVEDNSFGTHEFMELCELVGCEPYIAGNVGSGTVQEMAEWIEYMTFDGISPMSELRKKNGREKPWKLKYFGIGNENWGCGGNMRPEYYLDQYRQYQSYCKNYSGNELFKVACGPGGGGEDWYNWTQVLMKNLNTDQVKGISFHAYNVPDWIDKGSSTEFDSNDYYTILNLANYVDVMLTRHTEVMNRYDPDNKIGLIMDEWGNWFNVEPGTNPGFLYQQNTMRDAIVAAMQLNIFNRHCKRVIMANIAQVVNVLQAIILTEGEKMIKTPTFHVFDMFKAHQDAECVYCHTDNENCCEGKNVPMISSSASVKDGVMTITLANCSIDEDAELSCDICNFDAKKAAANILTEDVHACNTFDDPEKVVIKPYDVKLENSKLTVKLPACSVVEITLN